MVVFRPSCIAAYRTIGNVLVVHLRLGMRAVWAQPPRRHSRFHPLIAEEHTVDFELVPLRIERIAGSKLGDGRHCGTLIGAGLRLLTFMADRLGTIFLMLR